MSFFCWLATIIAVLLLAACLLAYPVVKRHPQKVFLDPGQFGLEYRDAAFTSSDGIQLVGWWIPAQRSTRTVILLHGYAGSCDPDLKYAKALHEAGFNLLLFDFRAHGRSGGKITSIGALEVADCLAAIQYVKEQGSTAIGLLGFSMGGRVALLTAAAHPGLVKAVISDGGPARLTTAIAADISRHGVPGFLSLPIAAIIELGMSIRSGRWLFSREPYYQSKKLEPLPVLFIHGGKDPHTRLDELETMVRNAGTNATCWQIHQAGHRNAENFVGDEYLARVISFFEHHLS